MKTKKPSLHVQRLVSDVLTQFMFVKDLDEFRVVWDNIFNQFDLCVDPFTGCPCSYDDYVKSVKEYEEQIMFEKYGHCDGLD